MPRISQLALGVDAGGDQGVHPDDAACLAHLEHQGVGGEEGDRHRAGGETPLRLRQGSLAMIDATWKALSPSVSTRLPSGSGYSQQVAGRHHIQMVRSFACGAAAASPEIAALARLGDHDVDGCARCRNHGGGSRCADRSSLRSRYPPAQGVGFSPIQGGDERREQPAQRIRNRLCSWSARSCSASIR